MTIWQKKAIKLLGRVVTGKTPPKEIAEYWDGAELFVSPKDMTRDSTFIQQTQSKISKRALNKFKGQILPKNSVMYTALSYGFGKIGIAKQQLITNQQINSIIVYKDHDFRFVYYLLRVSTPYIFSFNSGIDTPIVPKSVFEKIELLVPSFNIQRKIAAVLSAYDDLIENNNRRIAILEKMAEELYREWFVRLRFPGHEKSKIIKGIPEGWEVKNVGKVFERYIGGGWGEDFQMPNNPVGAFVIRGTDIPDLKTGKYKLPPFRFHKQTNFANRVLKVGDIIFEVAGGSKTQLLGRSLLISEGIHNFCQKKLICASFCKLIRPAISPFYLSSFLNAFYDCGLVGIFQTQSTGISNYHFEDFVKFQTIAVPSKELLNQFDATMEKIVAQKDNFAQQNWFLSNSRDKLLSRLMSGKIDLENLDIQFPASMQEEE
jgi:type I restriction enzyme S subunit